MPNEKAKKAQLSVTIDAELVEWVKAEAEERMLGAGYLVERGLRSLRTTLAANHSVTDGEVNAAIDAMRPGYGD